MSRSDLVANSLWRLPLSVEVEELQGSLWPVGCLGLVSSYGAVSVSSWYGCAAFRITLRRPLSAWRPMMDCPGFRLVGVHCSPLVMLGLGGLASWMLVLTALLTVAACFAIRCFGFWLNLCDYLGCWVVSRSCRELNLSSKEIPQHWRWMWQMLWQPSLFSQPISFQFEKQMLVFWTAIFQTCGVDSHKHKYTSLGFPKRKKAFRNLLQYKNKNSTFDIIWFEWFYNTTC